MNAQITSLPLSALRLSATVAQRERRAHFEVPAIQELAESIKTVGLLSPLVVRPVINPLGVDLVTHEIVAGERRFEAAKLAKLNAVPVTVRELTDEQVLEVQLVENLQRADVHPMAEAEGYEALHKLGRGVDEIAGKVGKSKAYVYARMKLLELCAEGRKAYYAGKLTASTALYVARVPRQLQAQAVKEITQTDWQGQPMSARRAAEHIQNNYMLRLSEAPFKTGDATLYPIAGACGACPKRTGNQPELFGDVKGADVCTDTICYWHKMQLHTDRAIARARETGQTILQGPAAKKVAPHGANNGLTGYVNLAARNYDDDKNRTWRQILGKDYAPTLLVDEKRGELVEIAPLADLPKKAKRGSASNDEYQAKQRAEQKKRDLEVRYRGAVLNALHAHATKEREPLDRIGLETVAERLWNNLSHDAKGKMFKALDWPAPKSKGVGIDYKLPMPIGQQSDDDLQWTIQLLAIAPELEVYSFNSSKPKALEAFAMEFGIDSTAIRKAAKAKSTKKAAKPAVTTEEDDE